MDRRGRILGDISLEADFGLEIGALHSPVARRPEAHVLYVDYAPTDVLRENFRHPGDSADIVDVDIVWGNSSLRESVGQGVDYVIASHVIEHVPDFIGWLREVRNVLKQGGTLCLAIPDRRFTFDFHRPVSTLGDMVEAYLQSRKVPAIRHVFDAAAFSRDQTHGKVWIPGETVDGLPEETKGRLVPAIHLAQELVQTGEYRDTHCWIFTPASFLDIAESLSYLGYFDFEIEAFFPTRAGEIEFIVRLRAIESDEAGEATLASIAGARAQLAGDGSAASPNGAGDHSSEKLQADLDESRLNCALLQGELDRLLHTLAAIKCSRSWRLTAPLRMARRMISTGA
jgi:SAM-dependent methyltransferase